MGSKKGDSRMDVAALTGSDSDYFDTQEYVFIRKPQNNDTLPSLHLPRPLQKDAPLVLPPTTSLQHRHEQSPAHQEQQEADEHTAGPPSPEDDQALGKCTLTYCCICTHGLPASFQSPPTWSEVCRVAMYALELANQDRKYFHIRKEICPFIEGHYEVLVPQTKSNSWRQTVNMTLSHPQYAHLFMQESQEHEYGRRKGAMPGYYCLRQRIDLYKLPEPEKKIRRKRFLEEAASAKKMTSSSEVDYDSTDSQSNTATTITTTTTTTTTTTFTESASTAEEASDTEGGKPNKKGLIKKLETDLFLYFLERREENLGDATLAPITGISPSLKPTPVSTLLPSIPALTQSNTTPNTKVSDPPCLPPLSCLPHFNPSKTASVNSNTESIPPHTTPKTPISVTQLINDAPTDTSSPFPQWQAKSKSDPNTPINWNIKRESSVNSLSRSPQDSLSSSGSFQSPPVGSQKPPLAPFSGKFDMDEYSRSAQYSPSKFSSSGRPPSPISSKHPYGGLFPSPPAPHLSTYSAPLNRSSSPVWQYEQGSSSSFSQFSPPPYPPYSSSQYPSHPSPYQFTPPSFQKGALPPHDQQPITPRGYSPNSASAAPPIQIHQSPLQQKQPPKTPLSPPSTPSSSSSQQSSPATTSSSQKSQQSAQAQQPQRRNRLTTRPWERAILEDYYISFFCQSRHSRREKVKVEELVKKLGWEISRIQRWLDNRRTKDRPRFGHPEFGASKNDEESDDEDDEKGDPSSSPQKLLASLKNTKSVRKTTPNNKRKSTDGTSEDDPLRSASPSPSPPSSSPFSASPPSSNPSTPTPIKKRKSLPPVSSTPLPPNPNQANTDFWVIKNK